MTRTEHPKVEDPRKQLVERVAASHYVSKSARLRDLLVYLSGRVLEGSADEIHEQEVGHKVFGRPPDYDTAADNIVRVNASVLRKRLERYFAGEGSLEPLIIEIPKGNYAPVFRERNQLEAEAAQPGEASPARIRDRRVWLLAVLVAVFASSTLFLLFRGRGQDSGAAAGLDRKPAVRLLWSQVFRPNQRTDIVLDDAAVGLYQELTGRPIALSEYFDRSYLRTLDETASQAKLDPKVATAIVLRRHSSYANSGLLWRLFHAAGPWTGPAAVQFARDYSFRGLKSGNVILLGQSRVNPWVEPFEARLGVRWAPQGEPGVFFPVDTWAQPADRDRYRIAAEPGEPREGYCMVALLPNLGATGNVLLLAGTGGSALNTGGEFLNDEQGVSQIRRLLPERKDGQFPYFEALLKMKGRSALAKDVTVVICRPPR